MTTPPEFDAFARLVRKFAPGASLVRAWPLAGGYSAAVTGLEIEHAHGKQEKLVVRQHGVADRTRNPQIASHEYALLGALAAAELPVPAPRFVDETGEFLPAPVIVVNFVDGVSEFAPLDVMAHTRQLAAVLARMHQIKTAALPRTLPQHRHYVDNCLRALALTLPSDHIERALLALWPWPQVNAPALLHGDFWPGNLLWRENVLTAILDWEDAALGDPLADLSNARLEVLWAFGPRAMHELTATYSALQPDLDYTTLSYWDLFAAFERHAALSTWGMGAAVERRMRVRLCSFAANAFLALP